MDDSNINGAVGEAGKEKKIEGRPYERKGRKHDHKMMEKLMGRRAKPQRKRQPESTRQKLPI